MELVSFNFIDDNDNKSYKNNYYDAIPVILVFQFLMIIYCNYINDYYIKKII